MSQIDSYERYHEDLASTEGMREPPENPPALREDTAWAAELEPLPSSA